MKGYYQLYRFNNQHGLEEFLLPKIILKYYNIVRTRICIWYAWNQLIRDDRILGAKLKEVVEHFTGTNSDKSVCSKA